MTPQEVAVLLAGVRTLLLREQTDAAINYLGDTIDLFLHGTTAPEDPHREQVSSVALRQRRCRARKRDIERDMSRDKRDSVTRVSPLALSSSSPDLLSDSKELEEKKREGECEREGKTGVTPSVTSVTSVTRAKRVAVRPPPSDTPWEQVVAWCESYRVPTGERAVLEVWLDEQRNAKTAKRDPRAAWNRNAPRIRDELARSAAVRAKLGIAPPAPIAKPKTRYEELLARGDKLTLEENRELTKLIEIDQENWQREYDKKRLNGTGQAR